MSKCSSIVFTVNGRVGFVDDGITFSSEHTLMISGACPPPAPSEWYVWIVRPYEHNHNENLVADQTNDKDYPTVN